MEDWVWGPSVPRECSMPLRRSCTAARGAGEQAANAAKETGRGGKGLLAVEGLQSCTFGHAWVP